MTVRNVNDTDFRFVYLDACDNLNFILLLHLEPLCRRYEITRRGFSQSLRDGQMSPSDWDCLNRVSFDAITWMRMDRSSRSMTLVAGIGITTDAIT
jgi:hypothetical protein